MPKYLMLDHGGVLESHVVPANQVTNDDIVLSEIDGDVSILKNGVQIVETLNRLVDYYDYQIVYHSSNPKEAQLKVHNELVQGAKAKGLNFPPIVAAAGADRVLTEISPENPLPGLLGDTQIQFMSFADTKSGSGKSGLRAALAFCLHIPEDEREQHIVLDDGPIVIAAAREEGYHAYEINQQGKLDVILGEILQAARQDNPFWYADERADAAHENTHRAAKAMLAGGGVGCLVGSVVVGAKAATASGAAMVCGMSAGLFILASTVAGAGILLLAAYLYNRYNARHLGFFDPRKVIVQDQQEPQRLSPVRV